jgi:rod shape-determining protein MreD
MDVASGSVIGQHPLAYLLLSFAAGGLSRRILWFPLGQQALHILPLLLATQIVMVVARLVGGAEFPGWGYFLGSFTGALLWFPLTFVLLLPQYQPVEKDENRPI